MLCSWVKYVPSGRGSARVNSTFTIFLCALSPKITALPVKVAVSPSENVRITDWSISGFFFLLLLILFSVEVDLLHPFRSEL